MASAIQGIGAISGIPLATPAIKPPIASEAGAFQSLLSTAVGSVEGVRQSADAQVRRFLSGEGEELHQVMLATQQAELSLELFQQVRNKVVNAYQEVMRMQM